MHWTKLITEKRYAYMALAILVLLGKGCKCKPSEPQCPNIKWTNADFYTDDGGPHSLPVMDTQADTVYDLGLVAIAKDSNQSNYKWMIGTDTTPRYGNTLMINFRKTDYFSNIPVSLITSHGNKPKGCFKEEPMYDTVTKNIYIMPEEYNPIVGEYEGYLNTDSTKIITFNIEYDATLRAKVFSPFKMSKFPDSLGHLVVNSNSTEKYLPLDYVYSSGRFFVVYVRGLDTTETTIPPSATSIYGWRDKQNKRKFYITYEYRSYYKDSNFNVKSIVSQRLFTGYKIR